MTGTPWEITKKFSCQIFDGWKLCLNLFKTFLSPGLPGNLPQSRNIS